MAKTNWHPWGLARVSPRLLVLVAILVAVSSITAAGASARKAVAYKWVPVPVAHAAPSDLFKLLGLTHITRLGSTRKSWEDPQFPKDLTDVVPYDTQHVMLLRGTESGIAAYRLVIGAMDFASQPWRITFELVRVDSGREQPVAVQTEKAVAVGTPVMVSLGENADLRTYRFLVATGTENTLQISCQPCFALPAVSTAPIPAAAPVQGGAAGVPAKPADTVAPGQAGGSPAPSAAPAPNGDGTRPGGSPVQPAPAAPANMAPAATTGPAGTPAPSGSIGAAPSSAISAPVKAVLTPALVSSAPITKAVRPGEPVTFPDTAVSRLAVLRKLSAAATAETGDYLIRITCNVADSAAIAAAQPANPPDGPPPARP